MDEKTIKDLIEQINQSSIREFSLSVNGVDLYLSKNTENHAKNETAKDPVLKTKPASDEPSDDLATTKTDTQVAKKIDDQQTTTINSPLVGVAYLQADPKADPYVKVGDQVQAGDVVCLIEAMKMMTEIKSSVSGKVCEILIDNESMVDYDQPLIKLQKEESK
ncbi:acetyl-CoA carboxylase biotin carboxyl carrier protein [Oenococcus sicerae]|uniref:acetyl-CoA carboxylase biotin carboxyl carrier protein n=1 Tax=Oenococcus sicerae TaxID=2203724 RepID=UPI0010B127F2|nr:Biotin carboxyl carrier protein of acetyl-CoA carboxylase [Oenococcus sicerae]